MDVKQLLVLFGQLHLVADELDEDTRERMQQRGARLSQAMTRSLQELQELQELKQRTQEQSGFAWPALLFAALQQWQFWAIAGLLVLLLGLCWWLRRRSPEVDSSGKESSSSDTEWEEQEELEQEEEESEGEDPAERDLARIFAKRIQWTVQNLAYRSRLVEELVATLVCVFQERFSKSFFPVLQPPIGVGSAFECWSPREDDAVYRLLVPLKPPHGHAFHLELGTPGEMPAKQSRVRVELECTCVREQPVRDMLCFLHHPEEELRRNQDPSLLQTLCTGSYLDVQKIALWLQGALSSAWVAVPQSHRYSLKVLPSRRSCKLRLMNASRRTLLIEVIFGVQRGDSDIFLSSQTRESTFTPSTTWPESCAVAEAKFFRHVGRQAPCGSCHLRCLQLCARILVGTGFSTSALKTAVMHLLTTIPLSDWRRRDLLPRLEDIMQYLRRCLEEKCLNYFFFANENVPKEIVLLPAFQTAEPLNLFQHLEQDPAAHAQALREFDQLQDRLIRLLFYGE
ncbi:inositol 1,4,5-trisphosphate receptor-interacting protein-like 1 [Strix uralensis]|uniref:inositol 1,4,5-trisphosphate receptor-interacting protein-like 1 n=1 Tax=Strix uralensis TaxID=36305 RepID=UPI003DA7A642